MKLIFLTACLIFAGACMKSKEDYRKAIDVQKEESRDERAKGSNDAEGMGADE